MKNPSFVVRISGPHYKRAAQLAESSQQPMSTVLDMLLEYALHNVKERPVVQVVHELYFDKLPTEEPQGETP